MAYGGLVGQSSAEAENVGYNNKNTSTIIKSDNVQGAIDEVVGEIEQVGSKTFVYKVPKTLNEKIAVQGQSNNIKKYERIRYGDKLFLCGENTTNTLEVVDLNTLTTSWVGNNLSRKHFNGPLCAYNDNIYCYGYGSSNAKSIYKISPTSLTISEIGYNSSYSKVVESIHVNKNFVALYSSDSYRVYFCPIDSQGMVDISSSNVWDLPSYLNTPNFKVLYLTEDNKLIGHLRQSSINEEELYTYNINTQSFSDTSAKGLIFLDRNTDFSNSSENSIAYNYITKQLVAFNFNNLSQNVLYDFSNTKILPFLEASGDFSKAGQFIAWNDNKVFFVSESGICIFDIDTKQILCNGENIFYKKGIYQNFYDIGFIKGKDKDNYFAYFSGVKVLEFLTLNANNTVVLSNIS